MKSVLYDPAQDTGTITMILPHNTVTSVPVEPLVVEKWAEDDGLSPNQKWIFGEQNVNNAEYFLLVISENMIFFVMHAHRGPKGRCVAPVGATHIIIL